MKLSRQSRWLLLYMLQRHPIPLSTTVPLPCDYRDKPDFHNLRGLMRRGWVREKPSRLFELTAQGLEAARKEKTGELPR